MRILVLLFTLIFASPALAQFWGHYENARFGYAVDIPPDFVGNGESDDGNGQLFFNLAAEQGLTVWGGDLGGSFEQEATAAASALGNKGWAITEQSTTADWATLAALRDHRLIYQRMIRLCDGASVAAFRAEFNIRDAGAMEAVLGGLARSFVPVGC